MSSSTVLFVCGSREHVWHAFYVKRRKHRTPSLGSADTLLALIIEAGKLFVSQRFAYCSCGRVVHDTSNAYRCPDMVLLSGVLL